jgi:hypothetical protein
MRLRGTVAYRRLGRGSHYSGPLRKQVLEGTDGQEQEASLFVCGSGGSGALMADADLDESRALPESTCTP